MEVMLTNFKRLCSRCEKYFQSANPNQKTCGCAKVSKKQIVAESATVQDFVFQTEHEAQSWLEEQADKDGVDFLLQKTIIGMSFHKVQGGQIIMKENANLRASSYQYKRYYQCFCSDEATQDVEGVGSFPAHSKLLNDLQVDKTRKRAKTKSGLFSNAGKAHTCRVSITLTCYAQNVNAFQVRYRGSHTEMCSTHITQRQLHPGILDWNTELN
eukprot:GILJ01009822.1.p1 GENE.GILJ01009822.1~~GILJ01009822.1.p1  ORF type:complete len:222 (-),score=10.66 GILJ01009822.1:526-1164(-)